MRRSLTAIAWLCALLFFSSNTYARVTLRTQKRTEGWTWPKSPVLTHYDFGLHHIMLTGVVHVDWPPQPVTITLLTFLKASKAANNTVIWHGRVIVYDPSQLTIEEGKWAHHVSPTKFVFWTSPTFALQKATLGVQHLRRDYGTNDTYVFDMLKPYPPYEFGPNTELGQPWVLHGHTPLTENLEYIFCVNDWTYTALITEEIIDLPPYIEPHSEPLGMYVIVKPIYGIPVAKALQQISFFVDHYAALGFNNTILYERGTYIRHLQRDAATAKQLHHGILKLMLWDHGTAFAPISNKEKFPDDPYAGQFDELVVYDHALTMLYGMNSYVLLADHDEFVILPQHMPFPAIHNTMMHGCLATGSISHLLHWWRFPSCTVPQVKAFNKCVVGQEGEDNIMSKALHFVDDIHSASMHWAKSYVSPTMKDKVNKPGKDCAFVAHIRLEQMDWDSTDSKA